MRFESATRTFPSPESDSWLASRPFINVEGAIEVVPYVDSSQRSNSEGKKGNNVFQARTRYERVGRSTSLYR